MFSNTSRKLALSLFFVTAILMVLLVPLSSVFAYPAWDGNFHAYAVNDLVTYNGRDYRCQQAHTSQPDWNPVATPALWVDLGPTGGTTAATATRTNTPPAGATNTPTNTVSGPTATRTNTPPAGATNTPTNTAVGPTPTRTNTAPPPPPAGNRLIGYFAQWTVYARNYHVKNIHTSGSASKLTHINYAFANVTNGQCVIGDAYADYDKFYDAASSVDGVSDTWDAGALRGSFNQLRKLKIMYPHLKVLLSVGGWTWSGGFGQAAANASAFANSCYNLIHDPRWNGVFDGIDIDWEYPNACGLSCDTSGFSSFKTLMAALRSRFGSELVTAAVPAGYATINAADYGGAAASVNWYNVMTYDFFGAWAASGPTAPHSPLNNYTGIPTANFYSDYAIQLYKSKGISASKLQLGIGFYGRGWTGVTQSAPGGSASGAASGAYEMGVNDYKVLVSSCPSNGTVAGTAYAYCGNNWWSYDTPSTIGGKKSYKNSQGLGGWFFWELSGDTTNGTLISAMQ